MKCSRIRERLMNYFVLYDCRNSFSFESVGIFNAKTDLFQKLMGYVCVCVCVSLGKTNKQKKTIANLIFVISLCLLFLLLCFLL